MKTEIRRYNFKLYPNRAQEAALVHQAALLAHLWNAALEQRETQWARECQRKGKGKRKGISKYDQQRDLKHIRAADPEYAAIGQDTEALCLTALDDAFKAFFRRAKGGAGKASGYPRFKSPYAIEHKAANCTIWHRDHKKGWRLDRAGKHFKVYAKGIPGTIKARGKFPVDTDDLELRDMRLIRVGGTWQCSIVVRMEARRVKVATVPPATVEFDLIDEFASVKIGADGQCLPGWEAEFISADERISPEYHGVNEASAAEASNLGADDRTGPKGERRPAAAEASDSGADDRHLWRLVKAGKAAEASTDEIQSERDTRYKRGSYRWRQEKKRIAKRKAKEARQRKEALHLWTTRLVAGVSELAVICPPIRESTATARGNAKFHGAAVKPVAMLNRHVLAQAPAMAIQMIEYKSAEAGVPFARLTPGEHKLAIGKDLPAATKAGRKARRIIKENEGETV